MMQMYMLFLEDVFCILFLDNHFHMLFDTLFLYVDLKYVLKDIFCMMFLDNHFNMLFLD